MNQLDNMHDLAKRAHSGQFYGSEDYFSYHIIGVVEVLAYFESYQSLSSFNQQKHYILAALGHDLLEDTDVTEVQLLEMKFPEIVVNAIVCLTKLKGESIESYISRVKSNDIALEVKKADSMFNLLESYKTGEQRRINKYLNQLKMLNE